MKLHINDANILIDIVKLDIVDAFLTLDFELYTTDFVFNELETLQQNQLVSKKLNIIATEEIEDFDAIIKLKEEHNGLSFEDCSVWYYAKKLNGVLITGDNKLRKKVSQSGITVKGIIFIIEEIKKQNKRTISECINLLMLLKTINNRLPINEIEIRISQWQSEL